MPKTKSKKAEGETGKLKGTVKAKSQGESGKMTLTT